MGLRCAQHRPHGPNLAQPSAKMRTRWRNFAQYRPHQVSKREKERDREPNPRIQKSRINRVSVGHGTFSSLSLLLCLFHSLSPFPLFVCNCLCLRPVSLSLSLFLCLCLSLSFRLSLFLPLPSPLPLSPSRYLSVAVPVSFPIPAIRLWGSIALPPSRRTGAGTSGVPAASFARRGLTARVHSKCTEGRVSRRTQPQPGTRLQLRLGERKNSVHQNYQQSKTSLVYILRKSVRRSARNKIKLAEGIRLKG